MVRDKTIDFVAGATCYCCSVVFVIFTETLLSDVYITYSSFWTFLGKYVGIAQYTYINIYIYIFVFMLILYEPLSTFTPYCVCAYVYFILKCSFWRWKNLVHDIPLYKYRYTNAKRMHVTTHWHINTPYYFYYRWTLYKNYIYRNIGVFMRQKKVTGINLSIKW